MTTDVTEIKEGDGAPVLQLHLEPEIDPRIESELERVNESINEINMVNSELFAYRQKFKETFKQAKAKLDKLYRWNKGHIEKARPYHNAKLEAAKAQQLYTDACALLEENDVSVDDARDHVNVSERSLLSCQSETSFLGPHSQEFVDDLNKATEKLLRVTRQRDVAVIAQTRAAGVHKLAEQHVTQLYKELKRSVDKSSKYFSQRDMYEKELLRLRDKVKDLEQKLGAVKEVHKDAFSKLELISTEMEQRYVTKSHGHHVDLSKFEEIDSIDEITDIGVALDDCSKDMSASMTSLELTHVTDDDDVTPDGNPKTTRFRSLSLTELSRKQWSCDLPTHDPDGSLTKIAEEDRARTSGDTDGPPEHYSVTFEMNL